MKFCILTSMGAAASNGRYDVGVRYVVHTSIKYGTYAKYALTARRGKERERVRTSREKAG